MLVRVGVIVFLLVAGIPMGLCAWTESKDCFQIRVKVFKDADNPRVAPSLRNLPRKDDDSARRSMAL